MLKDLGTEPSIAFLAVEQDKKTKVRKRVLMDLQSWTEKGMTDIKSSFGQDVTLLHVITWEFSKSILNHLHSRTG